MCAILASNSLDVSLVQAPLDTSLGSPFLCQPLSSRLHFTVDAPSIKPFRGSFVPQRCDPKKIHFQGDCRVGMLILSGLSQLTSLNLCCLALTASHCFSFSTSEDHRANNFCSNNAQCFCRFLCLCLSRGWRCSLLLYSETPRCPQNRLSIKLRSPPPPGKAPL